MINMNFLKQFLSYLLYFYSASAISAFFYSLLIILTSQILFISILSLFVIFLFQSSELISLIFIFLLQFVSTRLTLHKLLPVISSFILSMPLIFDFILLLEYNTSKTVHFFASTQQWCFSLRSSTFQLWFSFLLLIQNSLLYCLKFPPYSLIQLYKTIEAFSNVIMSLKFI